jgi:glycosyltransferase involved in cell wall biosynthesis
MAPFLSVVVPLFNEELVIRHMYERLTHVLERDHLNYEIIMINDGSRDGTPAIARELCRKDKRVKLISFSRNFGHQIAITAGMDKALGQVVVIIDADLQDPPEVIIEMIKKWQQGYQVVYAVRKTRNGESLFKLLTAALFYRILRKMTPVDIPLDTGDFRLMDRKVVEQLNRMRERNRFIRGMVSWVGFTQSKVEYVRERRFSGETKFPFKRMLKFAIDGMLAFSQLPLKFSSILGLFCAAISFVFIIYGVIEKFFYSRTTVQGWTSIFVASLFLGGVQLLSIGILGEYLGRIFEEIKGRPLYITEEEINCAPQAASHDGTAATVIPPMTLNRAIDPLAFDSQSRNSL